MVTISAVTLPEPSRRTSTRPSRIAAWNCSRVMFSVSLAVKNFLVIVFTLVVVLLLCLLLYRYRQVCQPLSSLIRKELENICRYPNEPFIVHLPNESISVCFVADGEGCLAVVEVLEVHLNHVVYLS